MNIGKEETLTLIVWKHWSASLLFPVGTSNIVPVQSYCILHYESTSGMKLRLLPMAI